MEHEDTQPTLQTEEAGAGPAGAQKEGRNRSYSLSKNPSNPFDKCRKISRSPSRKRKETENSDNMEEITHMLKCLTSEIGEMRKDMKDGNKKLKDTMEKNINQIREMVAETRKEIAELKGKENKAVEERQKIKAQMKEKEEQDKRAMENIKALEDRIKQLEIRREREEKEKRKNNLIIRGKSFSQHKLKEEVKEFIATQLGVNAEIKEAFTITNIKGHMVNVKIETWDQKLNILKAKHKLHNTNERIYIDNDLTPRERKIQADMAQMAEKTRREGKTVRVGYQKIKINEEWFDWDTERGQPVKKNVQAGSKNHQK